MAEWSGGVRPRRRSIPAELENKSMRRVVPNHPDAPGAVASPQIPGMVPDRSDLPGHDQPRYAANRSPRRPLTQYGTAEEMWGIYHPTGPNGTWVAEDFNGMSSPPWEELRKVNPALNSPMRPAPGYETERALALAELRRLALAAEVEAGILESGEAPATAMPLTAEQAAAVAAVPPAQTLLAEAGAASAPAAAGTMSTGEQAAHAPVVDAAQREGSLTGLGAPAEAVSLADAALTETGHERPSLMGESVPQAPQDRSDWAKAAPPAAEFAGAAETIESMPASAGAGHDALAHGEAAPRVEPPLVAEGAVGAEVGYAASAGLPEAAPQATDVMPEIGAAGYVAPAAAAGIVAHEADGDAHGHGHVHGHAEAPVAGSEAGAVAAAAAPDEPQRRVDLDGPRPRAATPASDDLAAVAGAEPVVEVVAEDVVVAEAMPAVPAPPAPRPRAVPHETPEAGPLGDAWWEGSNAARVVGREGTGTGMGMDTDTEIAHPDVVAKGLGHRDPGEGAEWLEESALAPAVERPHPAARAEAVAVDAADMGGDLYPGDQSASVTGRPAREGGDDGWLGLELETAGVADVAAGAMGIAAEAVVEEAVPVPAGAVRNEGHRHCPPAHPVKGNLKSMLYHLPRDGSYEQTIPEFCFKSPQAAEAAGFTRVGKRK